MGSLADPVSRPSSSRRLPLPLFEIMKKVIDDHKYSKCEGCNLSPPVSGQKAYMEMGGCLDEGMNFAEQYIQQLWAIVNPVIWLQYTILHVSS